jgi:hypothetical protein
MTLQNNIPHPEKRGEERRDGKRREVWYISIADYFHYYFYSYKKC